jgi:uncharacterized protein (TIGR02300 family)
VAKPELGSKRQCQSCSTKFFDLNRSPIICPKCGATFTVAAATRAPARAAASDDEPEVDPAGPELVSLEEADALEGKDAAVADDIEIEDDDGAADETFLEEEEEDADDVAGLIDGDIEDDEER